MRTRAASRQGAGVAGPPHLIRSTVLAGACILTTVSCGVGLGQNDSEPSYLHDGSTVNSRTGDVLLRDVSLDEPDGSNYYAPGAQVRLRFRLFGNSAEGDALVAVTSPLATTATLMAQPDCRVPARAITHNPIEGTPPVATPAPVRTSWLAPRPYFARLRIDSKISSGSSVPVTFRFRVAPPMTLQVPVELTRHVRPPDPGCRPS
jgi:hypothetical protein